MTSSGYNECLSIPKLPPEPALKRRQVNGAIGLPPLTPAVSPLRLTSPLAALAAEQSCIFVRPTNFHVLYSILGGAGASQTKWKDSEGAQIASSLFGHLPESSSPWARGEGEKGTHRLGTTAIDFSFLCPG